MKNYHKASFKVHTTVYGTCSRNPPFGLHLEKVNFSINIDDIFLHETYIVLYVSELFFSQNSFLMVLINLILYIRNKETVSIKFTSTVDNFMIQAVIERQYIKLFFSTSVKY